MKQSTKTEVMAITVVAIISIISLIYYINSNGNHNQDVIECIASKSTLYVSKTCGHCAHQKEILGDSLDLFNIVDCSEKPEQCQLNEILYVPTWVIDDKKASGVKTIEQLKDLTGC